MNTTHITVPEWITGICEEWLNNPIECADRYEDEVYTIRAIAEGGCMSGAYMQAVTYYDAAQTMAAHGDAVLDYIEDMYGYLPQPPRNYGWSGLAVHYLSFAVDMWAASVVDLFDGTLEQD